VEVLRALEAGTAALDQLHREMPIDEVERILEESAESIEVTYSFTHLTHSVTLSQLHSVTHSCPFCRVCLCMFVQTQSQISDMLSGGVFTELDDSELEAELEVRTLHTTIHKLQWVID
jgi:hypothetical protein